MGQSGASAGLQAHRSGGVHNCPRGPAGYGPSARDGSSAPGEQADERAKLSCLLHWGSAPSAGERCCRTAGCERGLVPMQVATRLREAKNRSAASTVRSVPEKRGIGLSACAGSEVALGESRLRGSRASLNSNCQKTGESTFHLERRCTLHAESSSTLSNSTNGWRAWQRRSYGEDDRY